MGSPKIAAALAFPFHAPAPRDWTDHLSLQPGNQLADPAITRRSATAGRIVAPVSGLTAVDFVNVMVESALLVEQKLQRFVEQDFGYGVPPSEATRLPPLWGAARFYYSAAPSGFLEMGWLRGFMIAITRLGYAFCERCAAKGITKSLHSDTPDWITDIVPSSSTYAGQTCDDCGEYLMDTRKAFTSGYQLAKTKRRDFSKRELETLFPRLSVEEIDAMSNGIGDALVGDNYRYNLMRNNETEQKETNPPRLSAPSTCGNKGHSKESRCAA